VKLIVLVVIEALQGKHLERQTLTQGNEQIKVAALLR
jgi:hypothetical protein